MNEKKVPVLEYFEIVLRLPLERLKKTGSIRHFFKDIAFDDENNLFEISCEKIANLTKDEFDIITSCKPKMKQRVYRSCISSDDIKIMSKSLSKWIKKNYPDYKKMTKGGMSYIIFLRMLLINTGKQYF